VSCQEVSTTTSVTVGILLLSVVAWFLVTVSSLVFPILWCGFQLGGVDLSAIRIGQLYLTNLVGALLVPSTLVLAFAVPSILGLPQRIANIVQAIVLLIALVSAAVVAYVGLGTVLHEVQTLLQTAS